MTPSAQHMDISSYSSFLSKTHVSRALRQVRTRSSEQKATPVPLCCHPMQRGNVLWVAAQLQLPQLSKFMYLETGRCKYSVNTVYLQYSCIYTRRVTTM